MKTHTNLEGIVGLTEASGNPTRSKWGNIKKIARNTFFGLLTAATLAACDATETRHVIDGTPTTKTQTYTKTSISAQTEEPTLTNTATQTLKPTATYSLELTVTYTPVPSIVVPDLNPYLSGVGEHGAMVCLSPQDSASLDQLVLKANISQNGAVLDRNVAAENIEGNGSCFEAIDAKYQVGVPISVEVNATATGKQVENGTLKVDLGNFDLFPFLRWIYGDSPLNTDLNRLGFPRLTHPDSYDLQPMNENFPDGLNHPVNSPCDGKITLYEYVNLGGDNQFHNLFLYCEDTGYVIQIGHMESVLDNGRFVLGDQSIAVKSGEEIGKLVMEPRIGFPHNHITLLLPLDLSSLDNKCLGGMINDISCSKVIDLFIPTITTGIGSSPTYGLWLEEYLPESTKEFIESGSIQPKY